MKALKNSMFTIITIVSLLFVYSVIFVPSKSSYSPLLGILDCNNLSHLGGCRHEIGHKMDHDLGVISESYEFGNALQQYMLSEMGKSQPSYFAKFLITYPGVYAYTHQNVSTQQELYAGLYAFVRGDISKMPVEFQKFYSTDPYYLKLYSCLSNLNRINICDGTSFSYIPKT